ncbi:MAG: KOW domain-containing RNA-binding protein [Clostridia bacterium]|nr:KOW domain-containing RNA-binding protein [Clostridia bacterium]
MKREFKVETGRVVRSKAGRDEGKYFVVIALDGDEFALVADGDLRGVEKPKRKRLKHLFVTEETISGLQSRLEAGEAVENHELRKWLAAYRQKEE